MDVVVKIKGREALAVWTLPYVTSWRLSPDMLLQRLAGDEMYVSEKFPIAFTLASGKTPTQILSAQWYELNDLIQKLELDITDSNLSRVEDRKAWKKDAIEEFWEDEPAYMWLDEFSVWYEESFINNYWVSEKNENTELCFNPKLPKSHAEYFKKHVIRKMNQGDVAEAYNRAGKSDFPWLGIDGKLSSLSCNEFLELNDNSPLELRLDRVYAVRERQNALQKQFNIQQLLDTQWEIIIQKGEITREFEGYFQVYVYLQELEKELQTISPNDYQGQKHLYDQRVTVLNNKIIEINTWLYNESTTKNYLSKSLINNGLIDSSNKVDSNIHHTETTKAWLIQDPKDPDPKCEWYIAARYFARQLVKDDSTLLTKRPILARKVAISLDKVGIKKRGGKKSFNSSTIKKALSNIELG